MSVMASEDQLQGLDGWGKKLKNGVKQTIAVQKAILVPTSSNVKRATGIVKKHAVLIGTVGGAVVGTMIAQPQLGSSIGSAIGGALQKRPKPVAQEQTYFDADGNQISKADYDAAMAPITALAPETSAASTSNPASTATAPAAPEAKKTNWLKVAGYTAIGVKLASMVI